MALAVAVIMFLSLLMVTGAVVLGALVLGLVAACVSVVLAAVAVANDDREGER
jgi:hypothetical protein